MQLGSYIKSRRKNIGYSQEKLAELVGVYRHQIIRWENNQAEPSFSNFIKLCEVLSMNVGDFIGKEAE